MTIYTDRLTPPDWDKSGERRIRMGAAEAKKYEGFKIPTAYVAQARDGRWAWGKSERAVRELEAGAFDTAPEAVADAAKTNPIIVNTAPAAAPAKRGWELEPAARKAVAQDFSAAELRVAASMPKAVRAALEADSPPPAGRFKVRGKSADEMGKRGKAETAAADGKPRGKGIGAFCEGLILGGKTDAEVLAACRRQFPDAATKEASVKWYRNRLAKDGRLK